jgi:hypothetical protein
MNKLLSSLCFSALSLFAHSAAAAESYQTVKPWSIGAGTYATTVNVDGKYGDDDIEYEGLSLVATHAFSDNFAIRAGYFLLENNEKSKLDSVGLDLVAYYGTGLTTQGFKAYIGGGFFNDRWKFSTEDEKFSGIQINGGIGYNWQVVSLELMLGIRTADDYADFVEDIGGEGDVIAVSSSLLFSVRF